MTSTFEYSETYRPRQVVIGIISFRNSRICLSIVLESIPSIIEAKMSKLKYKHFLIRTQQFIGIFMKFHSQMFEPFLHTNDVHKIGNLLLLIHCIEFVIET